MYLYKKQLLKAWLFIFMRRQWLERFDYMLWQNKKKIVPILVVR